MLHPSHTPTRAPNGGFSVPRAESQSKTTMPISQSKILKIQPAQLLGHELRNPNKAEHNIKDSPAKIDQPPPRDTIAMPAINRICPAQNLMSAVFMALHDA
jgi:hypothetical protein